MRDTVTEKYCIYNAMNNLRNNLITTIKASFRFDEIKIHKYTPYVRKDKLHRFFVRQLSAHMTS